MKWFKSVKLDLKPWAKRVPGLARTIVCVSVLVITPLFILTLPYLFLMDRDVLPEHCNVYLDLWIVTLSPWEDK